ncbi:Signal transducing histidine kinase, homodimeric domain [Catalinimonas alkaloidigena]|uniref:Chemotaxis protein CheA n=1 Tax=Catalinimonas alkaloidigena TaxID=1075417 RepID=A0A1G9BS06_9BACT|nr:chemotaxis protein CheA [Catalinimonas alkaloidigena]SDK42268.1 Signal transducing histidine kinase, homodimeric domain [Catalinimonas alkaloidigena]
MKEEEYKELFRAEAFENFEELNRLFSDLEKDPKKMSVIDAIFRITHTLKGNAMGMGFEAIAGLAHVMEDLFSEVKQGSIQLDNELFASLFRANDKLGELIEALSTGQRVSYRGIQTKLEVFLRNARDRQAEKPADPPAAPVAAAAPQAEPEVTPAPKKSKRKTSKRPAASTTGKKEESTKEIPADPAPSADEASSEAVASVPAAAAPAQPEEAAQAAPEEAAPAEDQTKITFSDQVQVPVRKLDALLNLVGELIIERDRLVAMQQAQGSRSNIYARLHRITSDLQYGIMGIRLVQIGFMFNKFHRIVRDVAHLEDKQVDLVLEGTNIEIDRNVLKIMSDSLIHLVRNAVSHGIEGAEERRQAGKPAKGTITLRARNEKDLVFIDVIDDGKGINAPVIRRKALEKGLLTTELSAKLTDEEVLHFIFHPGFSSAEKVTSVSGRGVGMDVVKRSTESIGGRIDIATVPGQGSTITLALPSSMAVKGALLFELNQQEFTIPLSYTEAVVSLRKKDIHKVGNGLMATYLDKTITVIFLRDLFHLNSLRNLSDEGVLHQSFDQTDDLQKLDLIIVSKENRYVGLVVDKLLQQKEIVEKPLGEPLDNLDMISGATILGNGNVCLVLDVSAILRALFRHKKGANSN